MLPNKRRKSRKRTETEHPRLRTVRCLPGPPSQRTYHRSFCGLRSVFPERTEAASASYKSPRHPLLPAGQALQGYACVFCPQNAVRRFLSLRRDRLPASEGIPQGDDYSLCKVLRRAFSPPKKKAPSFLSCRNEIDRTARFSRFGGLTRQNLSGVLICARKRAIL